MKYSIGLSLEEGGERHVIHQEISEQEYCSYVRSAYAAGFQIICSSYTLPDGDVVIAAVGIERART